MMNSEIRRAQANLQMLNMLRGFETNNYRRHRSMFRTDAGFLILYFGFVVMYLWCWLTLGEEFQWYWIYSLIWIGLGAAMWYSARMHWRQMIESREEIDKMTETIDALGLMYKDLLAKEEDD